MEQAPVAQWRLWDQLWLPIPGGLSDAIVPLCGFAGCAPQGMAAFAVEQTTTANKFIVFGAIGKNMQEARNSVLVSPLPIYALSTFPAHRPQQAPQGEASLSSA